MQRSHELLETYVQLSEALSRGAISSADQFLSSAESVSVIGTDGDEYWTGAEAVHPAMEAVVQLYRETGMQFVPGEAEAYVEGDIGWVVDRPTFRSREGKEAHARATSIFCREGGAWRLVHQHVSLPVPDEEVEALRGVGDAGSQ